MLENVFVVVISNFVKIIHVELTDKWWKISMAEMDWKNLFFEFLDVDNDKIGSFLVPSDDVLVDVVLNRNGNYLQDLVSLWDENGRAWALLFSPPSPLIYFLQILQALHVSWGGFLFWEHFLFFDTILKLIKFYRVFKVDLLHPFIYLLFHFQAISTFSHFLISQATSLSCTRIPPLLKTSTFIQSTQ